MTIFEARGRPAVAVLLAAACVAPSSIVQAQEPRAALVQKLADCRKVAADTARLACYDAAAAAFDTAEQKGEVVVVDRERAEKVRRQAFGFSLPSLDIFDRPARAPAAAPAQAEAKAPAAAPAPRAAPLSQITATLAAARQRGDGKWILELDDGAVWIQTDNEPIPRGAKKGDTVEIRRVSMGGYFINVSGQRAIRATRSR